MHLCLAAWLVLVECPLLAPERLNHANPGQPFLQRRQRLSDAIADRMVGTAGAVVEAPTRDHEDRQRDEGHARELRGQDEQRRHRQHDLERATRDLDQRVADELRQGLDVRRQPRHEYTCALLLEEAEREGLELVERRRPQCAEEALARRGGEDDLRAHGEWLQAREAEEDQRRDVQRVRVVLLDAGVDCVADKRWACECEQRRHDDGDCRADVAPTHGTCMHAGVPPDGPSRCALHHAAASSSASRARYRAETRSSSA